MIYVYRTEVSDGGRELARALEGRKVRTLPRLGRGDILICWGEPAPATLPRGVRVLNGAPIRNKMEDAIILERAMVPTVAVSRTRPAVPPPVPDVMSMDRYRGLGTLDRGQAQRMLADVQRFLASTPPPRDTTIWLPRRFNHVGGQDLLNPPSSPDYFSRKEALKAEFRIHCFDGLSIRAGKKVHRSGVARPHEWIRSYDGGWSIRYEDFRSKRAMRELAASATAALGLDFAAVDIGQKTDNSLIVLECNRAPGLEGNTVASYAAAIEGWIG